MANAIYPKAKEQMLQGGINLLTGTVKVALIDTGTYTYSAATKLAATGAFIASIGRSLMDSATNAPANK